MRILAGLVVVMGLLTTACASSGAKARAVPRPFPTPAGDSAPKTAPPQTAEVLPARPLPPAQAATLVATALALRGTPYKNGGSDPKGFDCSGFTQWVFAQHGLALPRETREQYEVGEKIKLGDVKAGDLVFFQTVAKGASHVGIVIDEDEFVHAPSSNGVVRVEHLSATYWSRRFLSARRVMQPELAQRPIPFPHISNASSRALRIIADDATVVARHEVRSSTFSRADETAPRE